MEDVEDVPVVELANEAAIVVEAEFVVDAELEKPEYNTSVIEVASIEASAVVGQVVASTQAEGESDPGGRVQAEVLIDQGGLVGSVLKPEPGTALLGGAAAMDLFDDLELGQVHAFVVAPELELVIETEFEAAVRAGDGVGTDVVVAHWVGVGVGVVGFEDAAGAGPVIGAASGFEVAVAGHVLGIGAAPAYAVNSAGTVAPAAVGWDSIDDKTVGEDHILHTADSIADIVADTTALELARQ